MFSCARMGRVHAGHAERGHDRAVVGKVARERKPDQCHHENRRDAEHAVHDH
jgi:hypothetical protein